MRTTEGDPIDRETKQPESYLTGQPRDGSSAARTQVMRGHEVSSTMGFKTKVAWGRNSHTMHERKLACDMPPPPKGCSLPRDATTGPSTLMGSASLMYSSGDLVLPCEGRKPVEVLPHCPYLCIPSPRDVFRYSGNGLTCSHFDV